METKTCSKCKVDKLLVEFYYKQKENRYASWCKECLYAMQKARGRHRKYKVLKLMGGKCARCGYDKNLAALHLHHKDPSEKEFQWGKLKLHKWGIIVEELKKCILVCANCHCEIHYPDHQINLDDAIDDYPHLNQLDGIALESTGKCPECNDDVYGTKYCCTEHAKLGNRKIRKRPSRAQLEQDMIDMPMTAIGKKYGVSDNGARKWAKQYGIIQ